MRKLRKLLKKYFPLVIAATIFLLPFGGYKAFAFNGGLLQGKVGTSVGVIATDNTSLLTDNDIATYHTLTGGNVWRYDLGTSRTIDSYYFSREGGGLSDSVKFYDSSGKVLYSFNPQYSGRTYTITAVPNVRYVEYGYYGTTYAGSLKIYEFDVYGPQIITHDDITNLNASVSSINNVSLTFKVPSSNTAFTGSNIYRNGTLIATLDKTATLYMDSSLSYDTSYSYTVTAKYSDGFETSGVTQSIKTLIPHNEITNLGSTVSFNSANLSWSIPNNQYLVGFKIFRDNTLIKTFTTIENTYEDEGLKEGTSYNYRVTSVYQDGYETPGVSMTTTTNTKPHDEVGNIDATVSFDSALISWSIPNNQYLVGFKVYRDSVLVGTLKSTDSYYQDTGLNEATAYKYKVTAIYDDGYETAGNSIIATTTTKPHDEVGNLAGTGSYTSTNLSWSVPNNPYLMGFNVYRDNQLIKTLDTNATTYVDDGLAQGTTYNYKVTSVYDDGYETAGAITKVTTNVKPHDEVTNLNADMTYNSAKISWVIPNNPFLVGFNLYKDDQLIKSLDKTVNSYDDIGLTELTSYNYKVVSIYDDDFVTPGVSNTFTTLEDKVIKEVSSAKAEAVSYKQVNLSWDIQNQHIFHHVNIYRAVEPKKQGILQSLLGTIAFADTTPTKIFETNGTYFNDFTVQPDTNYQYTLTSESTDGTVSDPVVVTAQTPVEPTPVYTSSGNYSVNQDGNYVFKWDQPTTGTVKIQIAGQDYKTVDASQQQITIPKTAMKTTVWGDPDVAAIPVGEYGTTGKVVALGGSSFQSALSMPIKSNDLLTTIMGLVGLIAPILLLVLVILYFKPIKRIIEKAALHRKLRRDK